MPKKYRIELTEEQMRLTEKALEECGLPANIRGEALTLEQFTELANHLSDLIKEKNQT